jgi:hypothetical protein
VRDAAGSAVCEPWPGYSIDASWKSCGCIRPADRLARRTAGKHASLVTPAASFAAPVASLLLPSASRARLRASRKRKGETPERKTLRPLRFAPRTPPAACALAHTALRLARKAFRLPRDAGGLVCDAGGRARRSGRAAECRLWTLTPAGSGRGRRRGEFRRTGDTARLLRCVRRGPFRPAPPHPHAPASRAAQGGRRAPWHRPFCRSYAMGCSRRTLTRFLRLSLTYSNSVLALS